MSHIDPSGDAIGNGLGELIAKFLCPMALSFAAAGLVGAYFVARGFGLNITATALILSLVGFSIGIGDDFASIRSRSGMPSLAFAISLVISLTLTLAGVAMTVALFKGH